MGVEHLQKLDVGGDEGDEVALVAALELGRRQPPQRREHLVAHERELLEGQIVVAQLLAVAQGAAHDTARCHERARRGEPDALRKPRRVGQRVGREHREEDGGQKAEHAERGREHHPRKERLHEAHEPQHHRHVRAPRALRGRVPALRSVRPAVLRGALVARLLGRARRLVGADRSREALEVRLLAPQPRERALARQQLLARARLGHAPVGHHVDAVGLGHGGQPVGDHDDGLLARKLADDLHDGALALRVHVGRGLVEHVHRRVVQKRTGKRQALPLPSREVRPLLGDGHVQTARSAHEPVRPATRERRPQLVVSRLRIGQKQVRPHRAFEQVAGERHDAHRARHRGARRLQKGHAAQLHLSGEARVAPAQHARQRGLARAALAHDARERSRRRLEVHVREHLPLAVVGIAHPAQRHARALRVDRARSALGLGRVQDGKHLVGGGHAVHGRMEERPERAQRDEELRRQEHHGKGREQGDLAVRELNERHDDAHRRAAEREQVHDRDRVQLHAQKPHRRTAKRLGLLVHARMALPVGLVDLERGQTLQVLEERAAQVGVGAPVGAHDALGDLLHRHDGQGDERHARQEGRRRGQAQGREAREQREGGQNRVEQLRDVLAEVALQLLAALHAHLHGLGSGHPLGVGGPEAHELVVHLLAHRALGGLRRGQPATLRARQARHAHRDGGRRRAPQAPKPRAHVEHAFEPRLHEQAEQNHERHVGRERDPLQRHVGHDGPARGGHHAQKTHAEHV